MKQIKIVGLCLVAVFAFSAVAAATASASERPEFKNCAKTPKTEKATGAFTAKGCATPEAEGKYRLEEVKPGTAFTSKSKAVTITADGKTVACKKSTGSGAFIDQFEESATISFEKCTNEAKEACGAEGKITTGALTGILLWANEEEKEAVIALSAESGTFAEFKCGTETIALEGFLLGSITSGKKGPTLTFAVSGGKQAVQSADFFGEIISGVTLTSGEKEATLAMTDEQKNPSEAKGIGIFSS